MKWSYGITTVPERSSDLLPATVRSLHSAGFTSPRIFTDRGLGNFGNWLLGMWELYILDPWCERYAMFEDDILCCNNLKAYLEEPIPNKSYLNCYTNPENTALCPAGHKGWYPSNQKGKGALGLVFSRMGLITLLSQESLVLWRQNATRGHKSIDGAIATAMSHAGWMEYVHSPSLVQHMGLKSTICNGPRTQSPCFVGEYYDPLEILACRQEGAANQTTKV